MKLLCVLGGRSSLDERSTVLARLKTIIWKLSEDECEMTGERSEYHIKHPIITLTILISY